MPEYHEMVQAVSETTNDADVSVAGLFRPVGFVGDYFVGFFVGNAVGGAVLGGGSGPVGGALSDVGNIGGAAVGGTVGMARASKKGGGIEFLVGVSPTQVHVIAPITPGEEGTDYSLIHTFDRNHLEVSVKARPASRRLILEATNDEARIELDGVRLHGNHVNDVVHELLIGTSDGGESDHE